MKTKMKKVYKAERDFNKEEPRGYDSTNTLEIFESTHHNLIIGIDTVIENKRRLGSIFTMSKVQEFELYELLKERNEK